MSDDTQECPPPNGKGGGKDEKKIEDMQDSVIASTGKGDEKEEKKKEVQQEMNVKIVQDMKDCPPPPTGNLEGKEEKKIEVKTVQVSNVSLGANEQDIKDFFSFSGFIEYVDMKSESERSQVVYVTFKDPESSETALLLSGATIVDQPITIGLAPEYKLPPAASVSPIARGSSNVSASASGSTINKAEDMVSSMLAKGFILGKDAVNKAKALDEKHKIRSTTSAKVASIDQKYGLTQKLNTGATLVKEMDHKYQVSEKSKSAFAAAEQKAATAGSAIMKNRYALTGVTWAAGAFSKVTKAAEEVGQKTKEKLAQQEKGRNPT